MKHHTAATIEHRQSRRLKHLTPHTRSTYRPRSEFHNRQFPSTVLGTAPSLIASGPCTSRRELGSISISTRQIRLRGELGTRRGAA